MVRIILHNLAQKISERSLFVSPASVGLAVILSAFVPMVLPVALSAPPGEAELRCILAETRWIAYAPTHYFPAESPPVLPSEADLVADLKVLRRAGFDGLITYGSDVERIPALADQVGFRRLLVGIWNPFSASERASVLRSVHEHGGLIVGVVVGNEGLSAGRYHLEALCAAMAEIGRSTGKPVSTTEPIDWLLSEPRLADCSTFLTVNAHPYFSNRKSPIDAVAWTLEAWNAVRKWFPTKPVLFKEVGLPSVGIGSGEENQKEYYLRLARTQVVFAYFEAFDATSRFKNGIVEQSWGLWRSDRTPKAIVDALPWSSARK